MKKFLLVILSIIVIVVLAIVGAIIYNKVSDYTFSKNATCFWNSGATEYYIGDSFSKASKWVGRDLYNGCNFKHEYVLNPIPHQIDTDIVSKSEFLSEIDKINKSCNNCVKTEWAGTN